LFFNLQFLNRRENTDSFLNYKIAEFIFKKRRDFVDIENFFEDNFSGGLKILKI